MTIQVITTLASREDALTLARTLVENRAAACVQIVGPVTSVYRWEGGVEQAEEYQCWIKTPEARYDALEAAITAAHPYDVPEILAMPVTHGLAAYVNWVEESTGD
ncbi:MAG: divalent-cation tolerance protein CutA [Chloroflexi bacterium]|nr:divalent-cation tolerance protein CutA [Chloroflexota bacterium]